MRPKLGFGSTGGVIPLPLLDALLKTALDEDLHGGDLTSEAIFSEDEWSMAEAVAKEDLVLSGALPFGRVFHLVSPGSRVEQLVPEGELAPRGTILFRIEARTRGLLAAERTALNLLQHLSGVATTTRRFVDVAAGRARITDTRKTLPGLRALERLAVRHGGGHNHRNDLGSAVLIKDNHIAAAGGIAAALAKARAYAPHTTRLEIEVTSLAELDQALEARADVVMLDNFRDEDYPEAVAKARGKALLEVSGGITLERVDFLAGLGVDVLSVGALTHSVKAADVSLRVVPNGERP